MEIKLNKWSLIELERNNIIPNNILKIKTMELYNENPLHMKFS